jgi:hypothetical protein
MLVFMEEAAESVVSADAQTGEVGWFGHRVG